MKPSATPVDHQRSGAALAYPAGPAAEPGRARQDRPADGVLLPVAGALIKALTISQPWASLIASGEKWVENRHWQTGYRGPLAIHAGKGTQYLTRRELREYPSGCIVAIATMRTCVLLEFANEKHAAGDVPHSMIRDGLGSADLECLLQHEYSEGPYCWILGDIRRLEEPIPCRGAQGLWDWRIPDGLSGGRE